MTALAGKHVLIVGGSSGIGLAAAKAAAVAGAKVTIAARHQDRLDSAAAAIGHGASGRVRSTPAMMNRSRTFSATACGTTLLRAPARADAVGFPT